MIKKSLIILLIASASKLTISAQDAKTLASGYVDKYRNHVSDASLLTKLNQLTPEEVIDAFSPYLDDSLSTVRSLSRQSIAKAGLRSNNPKTRQEAIDAIMKGLDDNDAGNAGQTVGLLTSFAPTDFIPKTRYTISQKIKPGTPSLDKIVLLTGYLGITDLIYNYQQLLSEKGIYNKHVRMNMQFANARMGDTAAVGFILAHLKKLTITNNAVYDVFPLLAYTRQKVIFDFLLEEILNETKNCNSASPDKETPIICAFRVMEMVAPYIYDFPVKVDTSGELLTNNYNKTLTEVRSWITAHKADYKLNNDRY